MPDIKHVLIAANYRWPVYAESFSRALEEIGVRVTPLDFGPYISSLSGRTQIRIGCGPTLERLNRALCSRVSTVAPDVCLIWNGFGIFPSTVKAIREKCWVTGYTNDDPFGPRGKHRFWRHFKKAIPEYDSHHVYRDLNIGEYHDAGARNVELLRSYYVPWLHYSQDKKNNPGTAPVVFIGHGEPYRAAIISALAEAGIAVEIYGARRLWRGLNISAPGVRFYSGHLGPEAYRKTISDAAICLAFLSRGNRDDYTRRYFEVPACGGFLLGERTPTVKKLFVEGEEIALFSTPDEAVEKCEYYLSRPGVRQKMVETSSQRCVSSHYDIISCASGWLKDIEDHMRKSSRHQSGS